MRRLFITAVLMVVTLMTVNAQTALKKVYDESIDPMEQIDKALAVAKADGKQDDRRELRAHPRQLQSAQGWRRRGCTESRKADGAS